MSVRFKYGGTTWEADTPEEARKLRQQLMNEDEAAWEAGEELPNQGGSERVRIWTPDLVTDLLRGIGSLQRRFLQTLGEDGTVSSEKVLEKLSLDSQVSLAGVLSGLSKQLKKLNLKPWDLYSVFVTWNGKTKSRSFGLAKDFESAADELGWPDNWK